MIKIRYSDLPGGLHLSADVRGNHTILIPGPGQPPPGQRPGQRLGARRPGLARPGLALAGRVLASAARLAVTGRVGRTLAGPLLASAGGLAVAGLVRSFPVPLFAPVAVAVSDSGAGWRRWRVRQDRPARSVPERLTSARAEYLPRRGGHTLVTPRVRCRAAALSDSPGLRPVAGRGRGAQERSRQPAGP